MGDADLGNLDPGQRADIAETHAGPTFVQDRGLELVYLEDPGEPGFDIVAYNEIADEYVVIEAKFRSISGSVSNSSTWLDRPEDKSPQMTNSWIEETIDEMIASDDPEIVELGLKLDNADDDGRIRKELIVVQNEEQNEKTVLSSLIEEDMEIDRVHIAKLERVVD